jgi:hypothetical protein
MWHDVLVEQITLAENVIRTIEDSGRQLASSRTGWPLNIADAIWREHRGHCAARFFTCLRCQPVLGS